MIIFQQELEDTLSPRAGATVYTQVCNFFPVLVGVRVGVLFSPAPAPVAAAAGALVILGGVTGFIQFSAIFEFF